MPLVKIEICVGKKDFTWYAVIKEMSVPKGTEPTDAIPTAVQSLMEDLHKMGAVHEVAWLAAPKIVEIIDVGEDKKDEPEH